MAPVTSALQRLGMTRTGIITLMVVGLFIVAAGAWYWSSTGTLVQPPLPPDTTASSTPATSTASSRTPSSAKPGANNNAQLVAQGGNYTCSLYTLKGSTQVRGTLYGSGSKTRADLVSSVGGTDVTMHVIHLSGYTYTWVDGQPTGTKVAASVTPTPAQPTGGVIGTIDANTQVSSNCTPWVPVSSVFAVPTTITFIAR